MALSLASLLPPAPSGAIAVALISGGLDSLVAGALAKKAGYRLFALTIDYNQRHRCELDAAARVATHVGAERHLILPLDLTRFGGSALTDPEIAVPKAGVGAEGGVPVIPVTYVPARNTIFLSLALGWAEALGASDLVVGVNALDYSGYPDCRPDFISAFEHLARLATRAGDGGGQFRILAPLVAMTKAEIVHTAYALGLDLGLSWSCYDPRADGRICGLCDSCRLRAQGFAEAGFIDPLALKAG